MPPELRFGPFRLDPANQSVWRGTEEIALSQKAFAVLLHIAARPGILVTKRDLLDAVWADTHVTDGALKRCVVEIRKALQDSVEEPRYIQTLHGRGYRFLPATGPGAKPETAAARPPVVGRRRELESLDASFESILEGTRQIIFITGEAGLGKTTLVDSWLRALGSRDEAQPAVGRGRCLQQFGSGEPYLPVFEALEHLSRSLGPRLAAVLRSHAPTWLLHMPSLISLQDHVRIRDEVFGTSRERMLREITDALEALSSGTPVVMILEDLHWSDPSTLDFLTSIATRTSRAQLMILATYRPAELGGRSHPLSRIQYELEIHGQCRPLPLSYLTEADIGDYLASRFAAPDSHPAMVESLHQRTSGNPLFVTCVVDELVRLGRVDLSPDQIRGIVPNTLQIMFEHQADQLAEPELEILDAAAAEGELFATASVAAALGRDRSEVESLCETLVKRKVILKRSEPIRFPDGAESPTYSFLHVLCRDVLYRRLSPSRRSRLHGALGDATEELNASDPSRVAVELAGHFELAGEIPKAIRYLRLAADGAAQRFANREATRHLEGAMHLIERIGKAEQSSLRMELLEQRALMRLSTMDLAGSAADFAAIDAEARLAGNVNLRVKALLDSVMPWGFLDSQCAMQAIEDARRLKAGADPILAAMADAYRSGVSVYFFGWTEEHEDILNAALPTLNSLSDAGMRCRFLWMEAFVRNGGSDYVASCRAAEESRQYARKAGSFHQYFLATHNLIMGLIHRGNLGEAIRIARESAELSATNHHLIEQFRLESLQALVALEAFDFEGARPICERIANEPIMLTYHLTTHVLGWLGLARLGTGALDGAAEAFDRLAATVEAGGVGFEYQFPLLQGQASCALARGDFSRAKSLAARSAQLACEHRARGYAAKGYRLLSEIAIQEGNPAAAVEHISAAMKVLAGCEVLNVEWQVYATAARALAALGRQQESDQARAHASQVGGRVAATLADEPGLRQSLVSRIEAQLAARASV